MLVLENGTKVSANGLSYEGPSLSWNNGVRLLDARLDVFSTNGESTRSILRRDVYPNHCHVNFPNTTHRVRLLFDGGVSLDGVRPLTPDRIDLFRVVDDSNRSIPVLGLADLGHASSPDPSNAAERSAYAVDMDNYVDLCLDLSGGQTPSRVHVICGESTQISLPKGLKASPIFFPTAPPTCAPQSVAVRVIGDGCWAC